MDCPLGASRGRVIVSNASNGLPRRRFIAGATALVGATAFGPPPRLRTRAAAGRLRQPGAPAPSASWASPARIDRVGRIGSHRQPLQLRLAEPLAAGSLLHDPVMHAMHDAPRSNRGGDAVFPPCRSACRRTRRWRRRQGTAHAGPGLGSGMGRQPCAWPSACAFASSAMGARLHRPAGTPPGHDADRFDAHCEHLIVRMPHAACRRHSARRRRRPRKWVTYRVLTPAAARRVGGFYSETEFDLDRLAPMRSRLAELGRSCIDPAWRTGGTIMTLWSALGEFMLRHGLDVAFGCASVGLADGGHRAASLWRRLSAMHLAPPERRVVPRRPLRLDTLRSDLSVETPALIRGYLRCGAELPGHRRRHPALSTAARWSGRGRCAARSGARSGQPPQLQKAWSALRMARYWPASASSRHRWQP